VGRFQSRKSFYREGISVLFCVTFEGVFFVNFTASLATVSGVERLDVMTPFDELVELRTLLTVQEIAEMTGMRRETLSRARPDSRFQRRTEEGLHDLYVVATRIRPMVGADTHLAAVLRRPQAVLAEHSIAELLAEGRAEAVLEHLIPPEPTEEERLANVRLDPDIEARLAVLEEDSSRRRGAGTDPVIDERVPVLLAADPELESRLAQIEGKIREHFGPDSGVERTIIADAGPEPHDHLYLRVRSDHSFDERMDRLTALVDQEQDLLRPVLSRLTIGFL
jgi:hypothetical protein